jgi:16S rRNA (guanine527-N7)-methyltransferase
MILFLSENLLPNLEAVLGRAEDAQWRTRFDVVTGRALAPLGIQLELSAGPCRVGGAVVPMRTESERPIQDFGLLGLALEEVVIHKLPGSDAMRAFPVYRKVGPTPRAYPRRWAEIKKQPL